MSNGEQTTKTTGTRAYDKAQGYLPYMRELGAMAILALVLYGSWDIVKTQGNDFIIAYSKQTTVLENLVTVQTQILQHLRSQEARGSNVYSNPGVFGPYIPNRNRSE